MRERHRANVVVCHYVDLRADLEGEMRRIARRLKIDVAERLWPTLVEAASFESMRANADQLTPNVNDGFFKDNRGFFHSGKSGQWRDFFDDAAERRYHARIAELTSPEVAAWAHTGSAALDDTP